MTETLSLGYQQKIESKSTPVLERYAAILFNKTLDGDKTFEEVAPFVYKYGAVAIELRNRERVK